MKTFYPKRIWYETIGNMWFVYHQHAISEAKLRQAELDYLLTGTRSWSTQCNRKVKQFSEAVAFIEQNCNPSPFLSFLVFLPPSLCVTFFCLHNMVPFYFL
ncbi:hypothetical protein XENOCAPTIV_000913 [Xenoophorus captivus]|uniref:Uncharacterized protein n=1 Tax=Xenoophorus captivus TaxID=1517983 RepID=A0ABV0QQD0_9TELE